MSALRKIVLSAAALFLGLSAMFTATAAATAAPLPTIECDDEWANNCP